MLHSFKLKIGLLSVALSALLVCGLGAFALSVLERVGLERTDRELQALADSQVRAVMPDFHWHRFDRSLLSIYGEKSTKQFLTKVTDLTGHVIYASEDWPAELPAHVLPLSLDHAACRTLQAPPEDRLRHEPPPMPDEISMDQPADLRVRPMRVQGPVFATRRGGDSEWRLMTIANEHVIFSIGLNLAGLHAETGRFLNSLLMSLPFILLLVVTAGWLIAYLALRPVKLIAQTAESVTATRLDARIPDTQADDEFKRLIALINGMLERLERSFRQATRFSADAAHELKTPLALLQAQAERALRQAADGSSEQREYASQLEELQRLKTILRKLLLLSQADAGQLPLSLAPVDLAERVRDAENDIALLAPDRKTSVTAPPELVVQADEDLLGQIIGNLVSNAVKFGAPDGVIDLALTVQDREAVLTVSNTGTPIPEADQAKIFERFYRADRARGREVEGSGLGLSLAREMARAHGGELVLVRSDKERTTFALKLPLG